VDENLSLSHRMVNECLVFESGPPSPRDIRLILVDDLIALEEDELVELVLRSPSDSRIQFGGTIDLGFGIPLPLFESITVTITDDDGK